ncbi:phosphonate monoester hydrolase [Silicimonas algicola]|uniref:Arylsulfatase A-like enzyme n=1 Tax=Silicimonas algicola TaxID=1826607 RepID=A0A316G2N5_9RHOB|nr:sulfatase-like hydrolase/transferase [Silicimonas algicola]AZQ66882.1 phosphonate monoester hydrolase [Silicimonas algicola]PWK55204.1 arylsulfatase A-like enzyme [Silicimonas algicola]
MNILFVMYDQLRFDYLSCSGHPHLKTPNFDRVAARGVRFTNAYVQSPVCGPSRMSFYTGRYVSSHGAQWNGYPLRVGELTLGDHLRALGMGCWLIGKTHMKADAEGMGRLGLASDSLIGARQAECGFDAFVRDDGLWGYGPDGWYDEKRSPYNEYLASQGYDGENPWADYANAGVSDEAQMASGWMFENAERAANVREEDSETPWLTREAMRFVDQAMAPWCAHVSYIKPHWPYIVPAPYHAMYGPDDILPPVRDASELEAPHPVLAAYHDTRVSQAFRQDEVRRKVIPAYMGLIRQCDDQLGRLLDHLEASGEANDTMIVLTSDHGDYLGDHWLGEKDFFHEASVKIPLIILDPRRDADATRGTTCGALVEAIDLCATFIEAAGGAVPDHIVEGRSLMPWLHGQPPKTWREVVVSEYDYSVTPRAEALGVSPRDARLFMVFDGRWKLIHAEGGFRPMLFDLANDPGEFKDLGDDTEASGEIARLYDHLARWSRRMSQRVTISDDQIRNRRGKSARRGILPFLVDGSEVPADLTERYRGPARQDHRDSD